MTPGSASLQRPVQGGVPFGSLTARSRSSHGLPQRLAFCFNRLHPRVSVEPGSAARQPGLRAFPGQWSSDKSELPSLPSSPTLLPLAGEGDVRGPRKADREGTPLPPSGVGPGVRALPAQLALSVTSPRSAYGSTCQRGIAVNGGERRERAVSGASGTPELCSSGSPGSEPDRASRSLPLIAHPRPGPLMSLRSGCLGLRQALPALAVQLHPVCVDLEPEAVGHFVL